MTDPAAAAEAVRSFLRAVGLDPDSALLRDTPGRVAASARELFAGVNADPLATLAGWTPAGLDRPGPVSVTDIPYTSVCEHHLLPFRGTVSLVYLPAERLAGLGHLAALVRVLSARPQMQERLTDEIAGSLAEGLGASGVLVRLDGDHSCLWARGTRTPGATAITLSSRGVYDAGPPRAEALALIGAGRAASSGAHGTGADTEVAGEGRMP